MRNGFEAEHLTPSTEVKTKKLGVSRAAVSGASAVLCPAVPITPQLKPAAVLLRVLSIYHLAARAKQQWVFEQFRNALDRDGTERTQPEAR